MRKIDYNDMYAQALSANFSDLNKAFNILAIIRGGDAYNASNKRRFLLATYKDLVKKLSTIEYKELKTFVLNNKLELMEERKAKKIAYSTFGSIIEHSSQHDLDIYNGYEQFFIALAENQPVKYFNFIINLIDAKSRIDDNIENIEEWYIKTYVHTHKRWVNIGRVFDYIYGVRKADKKKLLLYLYNSKPFCNDEYIIGALVNVFREELGKYAILM